MLQREDSFVVDSVADRQPEGATAGEAEHGQVSVDSVADRQPEGATAGEAEHGQVSAPWGQASQRSLVVCLACIGGNRKEEMSE